MKYCRRFNKRSPARSKAIKCQPGRPFAKPAGPKAEFIKSVSAGLGPIKLDRILFFKKNKRFAQVRNVVYCNKKPAPLAPRVLFGLVRFCQKQMQVRLFSVFFSF